MQYYKIGELQFCWDDQGYELLQDEMMQSFSLNSEAVDLAKPIIYYHGKKNSLEIYKNEKQLYRDGLYELYDTAQGKALVYHWARKRFGYGFLASEMEKENHIEISFHPNLDEEVPLNAVRFFSTAGLHSHLLHKHFAVLHSAYITLNGKSILFTAPSQTGKSTQAKLWEKHRGARIINEDRTLIGKNDGIWKSYGYPCSGSSQICFNETYPLKAIVVLEQGKENKIRQLTLSEKISKLLSGIEVYRWSQKEIDLAIEVVQALIMDVPVIMLSCTPDERSVKVLEDYLKGM